MHRPGASTATINQVTARIPVAPGAAQQSNMADSISMSRRSFAAAAVAACAVTWPCAVPAPSLAAAGVSAASFTTTPSGLRVEDIREGTGARPQAGDRVVIHWSGYTSGYQGKRIENTSTRDDPFTFVVGKGQVIPAFEEAVAGMKVGGIRRMEVDGRRPELGWPRNRNDRYSQGPQPHDFDGQRALDFVLDNPTLQDFNRTLLIDIKLLNIRK